VSLNGYIRAVWLHLEGNSICNNSQRNAFCVVFFTDPSRQLCDRRMWFVDVFPRHWNMVNGLTMPAHTRIPLIIISFFQNSLIIFVTKFLSIHEMKAAMSRAGIFLAVVFAVVSGAHAATNCSSADGRQIYKDGFQDTWLSGSQGTVLDDVSNVTIRPGTNMTLAAEIGAFSTFSMVTVMPFSTDSILDMWIQGTVVQDAMLYFESSESKVRSDSIDLSAISPESIAAADVLQDAVRIVGPDAADWFRLSVNTKILAPSNATETWDSIVFRDASGTGFSIFVSEAQILPNLPPCESRASSGCIGNVCNPVIDELFPQSDAVPLFGYGPIAQEISDEISAAGVRGISLIAKLFKNITYAEVFEMCAKLQGQEQGSGPEDVFVTSVEILEARSTISPNVIAVCEIDATTTSLALADIMAPVEWPLLTVRSYSFENITTMRAMVTTKVSYFDRDGIATTNSDDLLASTDAACPGIPWGLSRLDQPNLPLDNVFKPGLTGSGVHIYVLDTGVSSHSDFTGRIGAGVSCFTGTCTSGNFADANGHGTHVAGTAAGTCFGVAKKAIIHPVKVLSDSGSGSYSGIINGIKFSVQNSKNNGWRGVINLSLGGGSSASLNSAVNEAVSKGLVVAAAAGNDYAANACTKSPASAANALTVASVTKQDTASSFSNVGSCVDIWAPGTRVASASNTNFNGYKTLSGTSMATPHVAGAAALYLQKYPSASPGQVRQGLLKASVQRNLYPQTTTSLLQAYSAVF